MLSLSLQSLHCSSSFFFWSFCKARHSSGTTWESTSAHLHWHTPAPPPVPTLTLHQLLVSRLLHAVCKSEMLDYIRRWADSFIQPQHSVNNDADSQGSWCLYILSTNQWVQGVGLREVRAQRLTTAFETLTSIHKLYLLPCMERETEEKLFVRQTAKDYSNQWINIPRLHIFPRSLLKV